MLYTTYKSMPSRHRGSARPLTEPEDAKHVQQTDLEGRASGRHVRDSEIKYEATGRVLGLHLLEGADVSQLT